MITSKPPFIGVDGTKLFDQLAGLILLPLSVNENRTGLERTINVSGELREVTELLDILYGLLPKAGAEAVTSKPFSHP